MGLKSAVMLIKEAFKGLKNSLMGDDFSNESEDSFEEPGQKMNEQEKDADVGPLTGSDFGLDQSTDESDVSETEAVSLDTSLKSMERGLFGTEKITSLPEYSKISGSKDVRKLLVKAAEFRNTMDGCRLPDRSGGPVEFKRKLAEVNGRAFAAMKDMSRFLTDSATVFNAKSKKYQSIAGVCVNGAVHLKDQMDFSNRILEKGLIAAGNLDSADFPFGESYGEALLDSSFSDIMTFGSEDFKGIAGSGQMNSVKFINDKGSMRVAKTGGVYMKSENASENETQLQVLERLSGKTRDMIDQNTTAVNTSYRDAAVSVVNSLFGLNASVGTSLARTTEGGGHQASVMDKAEGQTSGDTIAYMGDSELAMAKLQYEVKKYKFLIKGTVANSGAPMDALSESEQKAVKEGEKLQMLDIDSNKMLISTMNMSALDFIIGHVDRHNGNFMVSENGVTAIDNDTSFALFDLPSEFGKDFSKLSNDELKQAGRTKTQDAKGKEINLARFNEGQAIPIFDAHFPFVTRDLYEKIMGVTPETLSNALGGLLGDDEIKSAAGRLAAMQNYFRKLEGKKAVVESVDDITPEQRKAYANTKSGSGRFVVKGNYMAALHTKGMEDQNPSTTGIKEVGNFILKMPEVAAVVAKYKSQKFNSEDVTRAFGQAVYDEVKKDPKGFSLMDRFKDEGETGLKAIMIRTIKEYAQVK